jgi:hypothetical protein
MVRLVNLGRDPRLTGAAGAGAGLRAAWRLEQAERERTWELSTLRAEWISIRKLAAAAGLSLCTQPRVAEQGASRSWMMR